MLTADIAFKNVFVTLNWKRKLWWFSDWKNVPPAIEKIHNITFKFSVLGLHGYVNLIKNY